MTVGGSATRRLVVAHSHGLHARPSLAIAKTVRRFQSKVRIRAGRREADASDILQLLSLGVPQGTEITLAAEGPDAEETLDALAKLFDDDFGMVAE